MSKDFILKNGSIVLSTEAAGGIYNSSQLKKIATLCDTESAIVKATEDQRLALIVKPEKAGLITSELRQLGLSVRHYQDGLHQPTSCIGELCQEHEQDALGSAMDVSAAIENLTLENPLKIGINGCAKCCIPCHTLDVSVIGDSNGYRISLGGKNSQLPELASYIADGVPPEELPQAIKNIAELYQQNAQPGESLHDLLEREGVKPFVTLLAPWSQDAASMKEIQSELNTMLPDAPNDQNSITLVVPDTHLTAENLSLSSASPDIEDMELSPETSLKSSGHFEDIPVNQSISQQMIDVPIEKGSLTAPEISMIEVELADEPVNAEPSSAIADSEIEPDLAADHDASMSELVAEPLMNDNLKNELEESLDEDAIAEKLSASMAEQEGVSEQYESQAAREENADILETSNVSLSDESDDSSEASEVSGTDSATRDAINTIKKSHTDEKLESEIIEIADRLGQVSSSLREETSDDPTTKQKWSVVEFDIDEDGNPVISWSNGVTTTISREVISRGKIRIGGRELRVSRTARGVQVEVEGMRILLPQAA